MASFRALSREGHAAMSMRDSSDRWILIQKNTFTNWVNEQLRVSGIETTEFVTQLETDFETGVKLCQLVESLQGKKIGRIIKKPLNHHQRLENVTIALNAIAGDNVRLVNIGMSVLFTPAEIYWHFDDLHFKIDCVDVCNQRLKEMNWGIFYRCFLTSHSQFTSILLIMFKNRYLDLRYV